MSVWIINSSLVGEGPHTYEMAQTCMVHVLGSLYLQGLIEHVFNDRGNYAQCIFEVFSLSSYVVK